MKILLLSILLLVPFLKNSCGVEGKHCKLPIKYHIDCETETNISVEHQNIIDENFYYWNKILNHNFFEKTDCHEDGVNVIVAFNIDEFDLLSENNGITHYDFLINNFNTNNFFVILEPEIFSGEYFQQLVIRHESGHVIGLDHNDIKNCLLSSSSNEACEQEILKIKEVYGIN